MDPDAEGISDAKRLKLEDFDLGTTLGTGSFGRVRVAKDKRTDSYVAVKIMKKAEIIKMKQVDHIMNENNILAVIDHPFIISMEGFTQDDRYLYLVIEFVRGGEMFTYLRGIGKFEPKQA
jgi:protein kinase A